MAKKKIQKSIDVTSDFDEQKVRANYEEEMPHLRRLCEEARYILQSRLNETDIKIHLIEDRVKAIDSMVGKARRAGYGNPLLQVRDLAGIRVVCLFRDDLQSVERIIRENFRVISGDNKLKRPESVLGYQSNHYVCMLPGKLRGARYEKITKRKFEIQVRTLCMHCWASVSHYIDYKGEWDVPHELKQALSALSGLFYVADTEFQQFNTARIASKARTSREATPQIRNAGEINFDTLEEYLSRQFPKRTKAEVADISELVQHTKRAGYRTIAEIDCDVQLSSQELQRQDDSNTKFTGQTSYFTQEGALRISLSAASPKFKELLFDEYSGRAEEDERDEDDVENSGEE